MPTDASRERSTPKEPRSDLPHDAIREQLDRILAHREFEATDRMRDLLRFVVEETLAGRKSRIKGYTIATQVFGRRDDFDASQDPIVSIQAGRLRRALERYYLVAGGQDPIVIDIPKGRYIPKFTARIGKIAGARSQKSTTNNPAAPSRVGPSIAVLPFENLTEDASQLALAVGMTDEVATELNRFQDLVVIPCQLAHPADGGLPSLLELGVEAGARFLLQGTIRRDPKTVKVSAHLTDAKNGRQIWAEAYSHPLSASRLIATQEAIARSVVEAIGGEYGIIARRLSAESRKKPPTELDTYEAMLRYYSHQIAPSPESTEACFVALRKAAEREPDYGPVWSALATLHAQMYSVDAAGFDRPLETALSYARRGVFQEPGSQLARLVLAYASYLSDDSEVFQQEIETALSLNPNSPYTVGTVGYFHVMRGDFELGLPLLDRAIVVNPCHPRWFHGAYVIDSLHRRDYTRALLDLERHRPFLGFWLPVAYAAILGKLGRIDEARPHLDRIQEIKPDFAFQAGELFRRTLKVAPIIGDLIDGLRSAGLTVAES